MTMGRFNTERELKAVVATIAVDVQVDSESIERGGDDSVTADMNVGLSPVSDTNPVPVEPTPASSYEDSTTAVAVDTIVNFGFETHGVALSNDDATESILITFRLTSEGAAPATGTALRTLTLKPKEFKTYDNFRVSGLKHKQGGLVGVPLRISAW